MALFLVRLFNDVSVAVSFCYCLNKSKNGFQEYVTSPRIINEKLFTLGIAGRTT